MLLRLKEEPAELTEAQCPFIEARVGRQHLPFDVRVASRAFSHLLETLKTPSHQIVGGTERLGLHISRRARTLSFFPGLRWSGIPTFATVDLPASLGLRLPSPSNRRPAPFLGSSRGSRIVGHLPTRAGLNLVLPIFELVEPEETPIGGFGDELGKLAEAEISLGEPSIEFQHHLLEAVGAHDVAPCGHAAHRPLHEIPRIVVFPGTFGRLSKPCKARVGVIFVAILNQDIRAGFFDPHTNHILSILLELQDQARKVGVASEKDESADFGSDEDQLHPVDRHPDVGCVLLRAPVGGSENQIDGRLGERDDILRITPPIGIGPLDGNLSADDIGLE